jgi:Ca2+-binding RTX toxin-like protein
MLRTHGLKHLGLALLFVGACSAGKQNAATGIDFDPAGYDGFDETHFNLLAADCAIDGSGNMTVTVGANETAYIFKRADGLVVANAMTGTAECAMDPTKKITINSGAPLVAQTEKVIIDFYSGIFGLNSGGTPSLVVALGLGTDVLKIRGTPAADTFTLGTLAGTSYAAFQVAPATARILPDLSMTGVEAVTVSTGAGNDTITGQGGAVLGAGVLALDGAISVSFYGGDNDDTLISGGASSGGAVNTLKGGAGNDYFPQQSALASDDIYGGTEIDTVDYSARTNPLRVTVGAVTPAAQATGSITTPAESSLADNDYFVLSDGVKTVRFAYQKTANVKATGSITAVAKANLVDGETFTINDGTNTATVFEFDVTGNGVGAGNTLVNVSAATDDASVAVIIRTAINTVAAGLTVTALAPVGALVGLEADTADATHNVTITDTVVDGGFLVSGMTNGSAFQRSGDNGSAELIDLSAAGVSTAPQVAAATYAVINGLAADAIAITAAYVGGSTLITLEADADGGTANVTILTSANLADAVTGMSGGTDFDDGEAGEGDTIEADVENIVGGAGADTIDASLSAVKHVLMGMGGNDTLTSAGLVDFLYGGAGNDTLIAGAGADFLYGGAGNDVLRGGTENDTINGGGVNCVAAVSAGSATTPVVPYVNKNTCTSAVATAPTNPGVDTLDYSDRTDPVTVDLTVANLTCSVGRVIGVGAECDSIATFGTGAAAAASVRNIRGGDGADSLTGDAQDNMIWGGAGNDTITGGGGNDTLYGEADVDTINGGDGNDYLCGGAGTANILNGDAGLDTVDASIGTNDVVDCGAGDGDILLSGTGTTFSAAEGAATSCEM